MTRLPAIQGHELLRILLKAGFYIHHQKGSHTRFFHNTKPGLHITIPVHHKDLPERTLRSVIKHAELTDEDFLRLMRD